MTDRPEDKEDYPAEEAARRRDEALHRALNTSETAPNSAGALVAETAAGGSSGLA